jgi:hypothetical protein
MTSLEALGICAIISLALSVGLIAVIAGPLRALMERVCPGPSAVAFWQRFTLIMLFLSPLFIAVTFGLPSSEFLKTIDAGEMIRRAVVSSIVGAFLAMLGMGLWVSSLIRRAPPQWDGREQAAARESWLDRKQA